MDERAITTEIDGEQFTCVEGGGTAYSVHKSGTAPVSDPVWVCTSAKRTVTAPAAAGDDAESVRRKVLDCLALRSQRADSG